jgi:hypothetical protein
MCRSVRRQVVCVCVKTCLWCVCEDMLPSRIDMFNND